MWPHRKNREAFEFAEEFWQRRGEDVINPHTIDKDHSITEFAYNLRIDLAYMLECDAIFLLNGWEGSRGAQLELNVANNLKMIVLYQNEYYS